jgi:uncharacterized membrane protein YhiD involved in acid resistance
MHNQPFVNILQSNDSVFMVLITAVMTILLSLMLVFTYDKTTPPAGRSYSFIQSLLLMSTVAAMIMQSIGDSLALSFGIFGALAIIRFRSNVSDLRDIAFIFATMAIGIACGVHSFLIAIIGTVTFCLLVFLLRLSPFDPRHNLKGSVRIEFAGEQNLFQDVEKMLTKHCHYINLSRYRLTTNAEQNEVSEYEYTFKIKDIKQAPALRDDLAAIEGVKVNRILFEDQVNTTNTY